jgi:predicted DNA-binding protein with PD1-like motif
MRDARIVVGPEKDEIPPTPVWRELGESHEIVGFGTIFYQGDAPKVHFHGALSIICIDLLSFGGVFLSSIHQTENNLSGHYP